MKTLDKILIGTAVAIASYAGTLQAQECVGYQNTVREITNPKFESGMYFIKKGETTIASQVNCPIRVADMGRQVMISMDTALDNSCELITDPNKEAPPTSATDKRYLVCFGDKPVYVVGPFVGTSKKSNNTYLFDKVIRK